MLTPFGAACACSSVGLAWLVRWALGFMFHGQVPFLFFFPAIVAVSWFCGRNAGLFATLLGAGSGALFLGGWGPPLGVLSNALILVLFVLAGISLVFGVSSIQTNKEAARAAADIEVRVRRLAAIVESSEDAIISKDLLGHIVEWNASAERLFGYPREEVLGRSIEILMPPDAPDDWRKILDQVARGGRVEHFETRRRTRDGRILNVSLTVSPVRDRDGKTVGAAKIARDVTADRAARAEREKTRQVFLGMLGHDLRSPLNAIQVSAQTLRRRAVPADEPALARITRGVERMSRMIDQILDLTLSRLGRGIPVHARGADLAVICRNVADEFEAPHPGRLRVRTEGDLTGQWDSDRLAQVISNLLSNAFKHGDPEAKVTLTAKGRGDTVSFDVTNLGPVIPEAELATVFDLFHRGEAEARGGGRGLGLGLYIAREIVRGHLGEISATSSAAEGTTFSVTIPRN